MIRAPFLWRYSDGYGEDQTGIVGRRWRCSVEQYNRDPEKDRKLAEMKKIDSWSRNDYVEKQG
jgi:hypothetical protein|tara:strand:- start:133 stop:321 length:189 start_codon:yes stop_codon:yes gene_type:complete